MSGIFFKNKYAWVGLFVATYAGAFFFLPEQVPLYYSSIIREDKIASKYELLLMPLLVSVFFIIYDHILKKLTLHNIFMQRLVEGFLLFLSGLMYLAFIRILILVL